MKKAILFKIKIETRRVRGDKREKYKDEACKVSLKVIRGIKP